MPQRPFLADRLTRIYDGAAQRLDRFSDLIPVPKQPRGGAMPFDVYQGLATQRAQEDPEFAAQYASAMQQYRTAGGS